MVIGFFVLYHNLGNAIYYNLQRTINWFVFAVFLSYNLTRTHDLYNNIILYKRV